VPALALESAVRSDTGLVRPNNEDSVFASPRLVAVADGVGGHAAGEVASRTVVDVLAHLEKSRLTSPLPDALAAAVAEGNARIGFVAGCRPQLTGMSTTVTAIAVDDDAITVANVGDSRAYLLREGALTQLTRDDSLVQALVDSGQLDPADARFHPQRSVVLAALDGDPARTAVPARHPARVGDRLLVCSDGLSDLVDDDALAEALALPSREAAADRLVELALAAGGRDNVSVIVADVVPGSPDTAW
jgi:protein phosphatase